MGLNFLPQYVHLSKEEAPPLFLTYFSLLFVLVFTLAFGGAGFLYAISRDVPGKDRYSPSSEPRLQL